jgi:cysteine-rich repeat protein
MGWPRAARNVGGHLVARAALLGAAGYCAAVGASGCNVLFGVDDLSAASPGGTTSASGMSGTGGGAGASGPGASGPGGCSTDCVDVLLGSIDAGEVKVRGSTSASDDRARPACDRATGREIAYGLTTTVAGSLRATVTSQFWPTLYARRCCEGPELACVEDDTVLTWSVEAGESHVLFVDGDEARDHGPFVLTLAITPAAPAACGNGMLEQGEECDDGNDKNGDGCNTVCEVECAGAGRTKHPETHHCYELGTTPKSWSDAETACVARGPGWHLAALRAQAEAAFANVLLPSADVWVGGNDLAVEGVFVWTNGEPWYDGLWNPGEPNNAASGEDCVEATPEPGYARLNDTTCGSAQIFLCELTPAGRTQAP